MKKIKIAITGSTGFIGRHVIKYMKDEYREHDLIAVGRNGIKLKNFGCKYVEYDINSQQVDCFKLLGSPDILIHLAWDRLDDYNNLSHIEEILPNHIKFIKHMVNGGLKSITAVGTCYEYGNIEGSLSENMPTNPTTPYSIAKDTLRRFIQALSEQYDFTYHWGRIFFVYGNGQQERTLYGQLEKAIESDLKSFNMSGGEQIRDYMHVTELSKYISKLSLVENNNGIVNICSGKPISVRKLVEDWLKNKKKKIHLNLGHYPYSKHEPFAFWGSNKRIKETINSQ